MNDQPAIPILSEAEAAARLDRRGDRGRAAYPTELMEALASQYGPGTTPESLVDRILKEVREDGTEGLRRWSARLDAADPDRPILAPTTFLSAWEEIPADLQQSLTGAADRIRRFHQQQPVTSWTTEELGGRLGQRVSPLQRVGIYVPGGSAPLPSSLLMSALPAKAAGVEEIVVATPPPAHPYILAAAHICEIDVVFQGGGAQAIGALAYGLEGLPPVDKIVGAGGLFVTLAKRAVYGVVGIDGLAGPTETLILADDSARPSWLAADLLAQAEHDPLATAILLVTGKELAAAVQAEVERQLERLSRADIIRRSLANNGAIVIVEGLPRAVQLANRFAAEHLCLAVRDPARWAEQVEHAGGIFIGEHSFEVLGDYVAGPSHVMPTGGTARFASPLSVLDFVKVTSLIELDPATARKLTSEASRLARAEGLTAHAAAAEAREGEQDV